MGFRSLQRSKDRRSTARGRARPASFRPQGLATLSAACSFRARAGLFSYRRRSWDSPFGASSSRQVSGTFPSGRTHVPFDPSLLPPPRRWAGPTGPRLLGFGPAESPWRPDAGLARRPLAAPLGFTLLGPAGDDLVRDFARTPPTRFMAAIFRPLPPAPRSIDQPSPGPARRTASRTVGRNSPSRVPAPARLRPFERGLPGL
jgi:hypothetical protein